jgi:hypothetical protein
MITRFELLLTTRPLSSQILDLIVLVPNDHRVPRIDDRYVERLSFSHSFANAVFYDPAF